MINLSPVDTERFGIPSARGFAKELSALPQINEFCKREKIDLLILRCNTQDIDLAHALEKQNFFLMDTLLYFRYFLSKKDDLQSKDNIFPISDGEESHIRKISQKAFANYRSHYHADPRLDPQKSDEGYLNWAMRSARKEIADEVLVAKTDGKINGFLSLKKNSTSEVEGPLFAVSPDVQGQGLGRSLMKSAFQWAYEQRAKEFIISTQVTNLASQNLWTSLGMKSYRSFYTFHKWFD